MRTIRDYGRVRGRSEDSEWAAAAACELAERQHVEALKVDEALLAQLDEFRHGCEGACRADNDRGGDGNGVADGAEDSGAITVCGSASERRDRDDDAVSGDPLQTEYASASAETLFGTPERWASEQASRWSEDGIDVFSYEKPDSVRRIVVAGLGASAPVCALFWVAALWSAAGRHALTLPLAFVPSAPIAGALPADAGLWSGNGMFPMSSLLWPLAVMLISGLATSVYRRVLRDVSYALAVVTTAIVAVGGGVGCAALTEWLFGARHVNAAWMLATAVFSGIASCVVGRIWKEPRRREGADPASSPFVDDATWLREVGRLLRERGDIIDRAARRICRDARDYATETGSSLVSEFGTPAEYAHRLRATAVRARRALMGCILSTVMMLTLVAVLILLAVHGEWSASLTVPAVVYALMLVGVLYALIDAIRDYRRAAIQACR